MKELNGLERILQATKQTQLGAIVRCAYGFEREELPRFEGRANVTSDGFIMCSFVDAHGAMHHGAFVGSYADWLRNIEGVSKHCDLTAAEHAEFQSTMYRWIAKDWRI